MGAHASQNPHHAHLTLTTLGTLFSMVVTPREKESSHRRQIYLESIQAGEDSLGHGQSHMHLEHTDTGKSKKWNSSSTG